MTGVAAVCTKMDSAHMEAATCNGVAISPANALGRFRMSSDGDAYRGDTAGVFTSIFTWLTGLGAASDYEVRWTTVSGTLTGGTDGAWESLGTTRNWTRNRTSDTPGTTTVVGTVEIRNASTLVVLASATITIQGIVTT